MTRGLKHAWSWRRALWFRESPGTGGLLLFSVLPLLFFLPLERVTFFGGDRLRGIAVLSWLLSVALALAVRGGQSLRDETAIWTFQKGISPGETALEDWILDMGFLAAAALWWAILGALALGDGTPSVLGAFLAFFALGLTTGLVTHTLSLLLSALGSKRPSDPSILLAILSILLPVLAMEMPEWVRDLGEWALPPFHAAIELSGALRGWNPGEAAAALLHILAYSGVLLALGLWRMAAWRPRA